MGCYPIAQKARRRGDDRLTVIHTLYVHGAQPAAVCSFADFRLEVA
jgi:hypothetical protein